MASATQCTGVLLWFDVPGDGRFHPAAISICTDCGTIFVAGKPRDARHEDPLVVPGER